MDTEANSVAAGCGGRSPPEGGSECDLVSIIPTQGRLARAKWLDLFFEKFRGSKATVLGSDCCELVKFLGLDSQSFASMTELLDEATGEEGEDWDEMYKVAVNVEIDTVLVNLAAELIANGGSPAAVSFDIAVLNEIRQQMNACIEDNSKSEDDKKRWGEYDEWCKGLLDVRSKEKENEMMKAARNAAMKERLVQLVEKKRVAEQTAASTSPIKVKRDGDIAVSPRRFTIANEGGMILTTLMSCAGRNWIGKVCDSRSTKSQKSYLRNE